LVRISQRCRISALSRWRIVNSEATRDSAAAVSKKWLWPSPTLTAQTEPLPATDLVAIEPSLTYAAGNVVSTGPKNVSVRVSNVVASPRDHQIWAAAALSKSGTCFWIKDQATGAAAGTTYGSTSDQTKCTGNAARAAAAASW
jgi:hypothetical protein